MIKKKRDIKELYEFLRNIKKICEKNPGLWNVVGYERDWQMYPESLDFLERDSDYYSIKALERDIYLDAINPYLKSLGKNSLILDAGGGIGRFAILLAKMGYKVHLIDACKNNLKVALKHISRKKLLKNINLTHADAENLHMFEDNKFDSTFAIELICYCANPKKVLKELVRVTKNGGLIFISVEGKYGSLISDNIISANNFNSVFEKGELLIKEYLYVKYYTKEEFEKLLKKFEIEILDIRGCQYVTDGIFRRFTSGDKKLLIKIEKICQNDKIMKNLGRVWLAIVKVKK